MHIKDNKIKKGDEIEKSTIFFSFAREKHSIKISVYDVRELAFL